MSEEFQEAEAEAKQAHMRLVKNEEDERGHAEEIRKEPNLVRRAKLLQSNGILRFPEEKPVNTGGMIINQPLLSDLNFHAVYEALFGNALPSRPHFDTFRGLPVDHTGNVWDKNSPCLELLSACSIVGLKGAKTSDVQRTFRDWIVAERMNDLQQRFETMLPKWDGVKRLDTLLIQLFQPHDTPLNRAFGQYFWLSIYNRVMFPGCYAPMALALFGAQDAGKSYMSKLICVEVTGRKNADSVPLDLAADRNSFLRTITGKSIIANVGEMTGFTRGDLNKIKDFMTRTSDMLDFKFENTIDQPRQWVVVMDGNKYEGLQRDETGNRRLYPMFVGQLPDKDGQPHWRDNFVVDYSNFSNDFWQVMAEARAWIEAKGHDAYLEFARGVSKQVKDFSQAEMDRGRGTIRDDEMDAFIFPALRRVKKVAYDKGRKWNGTFIKVADLIVTLQNINRRMNVTPRHLKTKMVSLGSIPATITNEKGYLFEEYKTLEEFDKFLKIDRSTGVVGDEDIGIGTESEGLSAEGGGSDAHGGF